MIVVHLREAMERYRLRTGHRMTYRQLAEETGISESTLQAIAARPGYNTTLETVDLIVSALRCGVDELLEHVPTPIVTRLEGGPRDEPRSE